MIISARSKADTFLLFAAGLLLIAVTGFLFVRDEVRDWNDHQKVFGNLVAERFGEEAAEAVSPGIRQIWVEEIDVVDRCTTCHMGITWKGFEEEENPYKTHPDMQLLRSHPVEHYGCTVCHGGQGYALEEQAAHGYVKHWEEPMLSKAIAGEYLIKSNSALIEMNCNVCHRYERETAGMAFINHGKELVRTKACKACHIINGSGGTIGPDLTDEGEKHAEGLDFSNLTGFRSAFNWHVSHFKNPIAVVPNSIMPDMNLSTYDAQALTILSMSWKRSEYPVAYIPDFQQEEERTLEEIAEEKRLLEGDGAFFIEKGCFVCHSISSWGIISPSEKGPDLADAEQDVRTRFGKTLEEFIFKPTGTMEIILSSQIILSDEEKWEVVNKLREAYRLKQAQRAEQQIQRPVE
jgi:cytochrome c551/c552